MKFLLVMALAGSALLAAAIPAGAADAPALRPEGPPIRLIDISEFAAKKDEYVQEMQTRMTEWRQELAIFSDKAKADGKAARDQAAEGLNIAWAKTKEASHQVAQATQDSWERAKESFETTSQELQDKWQLWNQKHG